MVSKVSGVSLADKIATGNLTAEEKKALQAQREESLKKQSLWKKQQEAKKEFGRGFQIELEKEKRVNAGLPEYDIQKSDNAPKKTGRGKYVRADEIAKRQQGSEALGELRKKSRAKALVAKAEHQAATQSASGKHIHKELKAARNLDPSSTKNINEKELIKKAGQDIKPVEKSVSNVINTADDVAKDAGKVINTTTKKSGGFFSKIGKFFKGKGGKVAIFTGLAALLAAGGAYIYNKVTSNKSEAHPAQEPSVEPPKASAQKPTPAAQEAPAPSSPVNEKEEQPKVDEKNKTNPAEQNPDKNKEISKDYVVKKGDCVWNIAKQHLKDLSNDPTYNPTDAEILKHTKELMELNQLQFEPDGYHVMIKPNDNLKLVA